MNKSTIFAAATATVLVLGGCSSGETTSEPTTTEPAAGLLERHDLGGMDPVEIIEHLDRLGGADRPTELMASIRVEELVLSDAEEEVALDLPDDSFYLSFAPYVTQTHECFYHSLTTCQGELAEEEVDVLIRDADGEVLLDDQVTTFANGFVGVWLPRDIQGTLEVTADGLTGEVPIATTDDGATCVTTLQLT